MAVKAMGGCCQICRKKKADRQMSFHHIDKKSKLYNFSKIYVNKSWEVLIIELRKCVLLCLKCHRKVDFHGLRLPNNYQGLNEEWVSPLYGCPYDSIILQHPLQPKIDEISKRFSYFEYGRKLQTEHFIDF